MNMKELIESYAEFAIQGYMKGELIELKNTARIKHIIYAGMGGSAISGDIIRELTADYINVPFSVIRHYHLPKYAGQDTLVILSSFSGNTEETLSCADDAVSRQCKILCICKGGKLADKCSSSTQIKLSGEIPPRTALPKTLFALMKALKPFYRDSKLADELEHALSHLKRDRMACNDALVFADKCKDRIPFLYCDSAYSAVVRRAANQLSENSKHIAHFNVIPEMNHNEIVGMHMPQYIRKKATAVFIDFGHSMDRIKKRISVTETLLREEGFDTHIIKFDNDNSIINIISAILFFDWVSYYMSEINGVNAMTIERIDTLKERMSH